jgi:hypothetical protein
MRPVSKPVPNSVRNAQPPRQLNLGFSLCPSSAI